MAKSVMDFTTKDVEEFLLAALKNKEYKSYNVTWDVLDAFKSMFPEAEAKKFSVKVSKYNSSLQIRYMGGIFCDIYPHRYVISRTYQFGTTTLNYGYKSFEIYGIDGTVADTIKQTVDSLNKQADIHKKQESQIKELYAYAKKNFGITSTREFRDLLKYFDSHYYELTKNGEFN